MRHAYFMAELHHMGKEELLCQYAPVQHVSRLAITRNAYFMADSHHTGKEEWLGQHAPVPVHRSGSSHTAPFPSLFEPTLHGGSCSVRHQKVTGKPNAAAGISTPQRGTLPFTRHATKDHEDNLRMLKQCLGQCGGAPAGQTRVPSARSRPLASSSAHSSQTAS